MPAELVFDRKLIANDLRRLASMYLDRRAPFNHLPVEQKHRPDQFADGSHEHALFLGFAGWLQRNGMDGEKLAMNASELAANHPWVFDPRHAKSKDQSEFDFLYRFMPYADAGNVYKPVQMWFDTLRLVRDRYGSDWRNIFLGFNSTGDAMADRVTLIRCLDDLPGVGHKIAQLIIQWFQEVDWPADQQVWSYIRTIPVLAVDMWLMRLVYQFGYITDWSTDSHTAISSPISDALCRICYEEGIEHHAVGQALWRIGAVVCRQRPRNDDVAFRRYCKAHCPAFELCQGVVPANYSGERRRNGSGSGRLASMQWGRMIVHPEIDLTDLSDYDPEFRVEGFTPRPRNFGAYASAEVKKNDLGENQLSLEGLLDPD